MAKESEKLDVKMANGDRANILGNFLVQQMREHFPDYPIQDLLFGTAAALAFLARESRAVHADLLNLVRKCLRAPLSVKKPGQPGQKTTN